MAPPLRLRRAVELLRTLHGRPDPPPTDPWVLVLQENVAYLADDARRREAMSVLRARVGLRAEEILSAPDEALLAATRFGILPGPRAGALRRCAQIALEEFDGDLRQVLDWPLAKARRALRRFPGIGGPGADRILLFCRREPILAPESNGLRVLVRLGFGREAKSYATTYRLAQEAIAGEAGADTSWLVEAHQLLRRHGQELCTRSRPRCGACPLARDCPSSETPAPARTARGTTPGRRSR